MGSKTIYYVAGAAALIYILTMKTSKAFASPTNSGKIRGCDRHGCGHYGASRGNRAHAGVDFVTVPGQDIYSPIEGKVTRFPRPYANDANYTGIEIDNGTYKLQLFYMTGSIPVGTAVKVGQKIGTAQNIAAKYSAGMTNHIHMQVQKNGVMIDPTTMFQDATLNLSLLLSKGLYNSPEVKRLQQLLGVVADGHFGPQTELALIARKGVTKIALKDF
jgi:murein DD-endopeptidase MepM/ murein hydrolase activator NlpD